MASGPAHNLKADCACHCVLLTVQTDSMTVGQSEQPEEQVLQGVPVIDAGGFLQQVSLREEDVDVHAACKWRQPGNGSP